MFVNFSISYFLIFYSKMLILRSNITPKDGNRRLFVHYFLWKLTDHILYSDLGIDVEYCTIAGLSYLMEDTDLVLLPAQAC